MKPNVRVKPAMLILLVVSIAVFVLLILATAAQYPSALRDVPVLKWFH